tara:strand:- start:579 stop:1610 length:1032 start_codon:yes stop_codon:yes gene_type:complete
MTSKRESLVLNKTLENLGEFFRNINFLNPEYSNFFNSIKLAENENNWFTKKNILYAFKVWGENLTKINIDTWLKQYRISNSDPKKILIIMPGNIPLVGLHDLLSVIVSGNHAVVKCSSRDSILIPFIATLEGYISKNTSFISGAIKENKFDAVIATGSNNSVRYFKHFFSNYPAIIRNNKTSVAVITGEETKNDLDNLANDLLSYYGLGCRNVSKIFVPQGYDLYKIIKSLKHWSKVINLDKYSNNYKRNKALLTISNNKFLDNGFFLLERSQNLYSPIGSAYYEFYSDKNVVLDKIKTNMGKIQCVVSNEFSEISIPFGSAQAPMLWDYADEIDTIDFLNKL